MKAIAAVIVLAILGGFACWRLMQHPEPDRPATANEMVQPAIDQVQEALKEAQEAAKNGGSVSIVIGPDGKKHSISFSMNGAQNVQTNTSISGEGPTAAKIRVTLNQAEPLILTKSAVDRIQPGMAFPQVAETLGGELTKGRLGAGFTGVFIVKQANRSVEITFVDGKVTKTAATGVD